MTKVRELKEMREMDGVINDKYEIWEEKKTNGTTKSNEEKPHAIARGLEDEKEIAWWRIEMKKREGDWG